MRTGEITISAEPKERTEGEKKVPTKELRLTSAGKGANTDFNQSSRISVPDDFPLPAQGMIRLKAKTEAGDGNFGVWLWTAGKQPESKKLDEPLEESARRSEWALLVLVSIKRRQDSHRITLTPPQKNIFPAATMVFVGPSFKKALEDWKDVAISSPTEPFGHAKTNAEAILAEKVKVDAKDPKRGAAEFVIEKWRISTGKAIHVATETLTLERPAADSQAWSLTAESREKIKKRVAPGP